MKTNDTELNALLALGFSHLDKVEHHGESPPEKFHYLFRKYKNNYQYVSLMYGFYGDKYSKEEPRWGNFLEASFEAYWVPKNTRRPKHVLQRREMQLKGWASVGSNLCRSVGELVHDASQEYELSLPEKGHKL
jgi:hypothetical protein